MSYIERSQTGSRSEFTHGSLRSSPLALLVAPVGVGFTLGRAPHSRTKTRPEGRVFVSPPRQQGRKRYPF